MFQFRVKGTTLSRDTIFNRKDRWEKCGEFRLGYLALIFSSMIEYVMSRKLTVLPAKDKNDGPQVKLRTLGNLHPPPEALLNFSRDIRGDSKKCSLKYGRI